MLGRLRGNPTNLLPLLCALYLILYLDRVNIATAAPLIQGELHLSNAALGVVLSAFAYTYALCQLIGGLAGEKFGPRTTLSVSVVVVCIATAATGFAGGLAGLIAARIALGLGEGAALPTATQAMAKSLPQARWGFAQGITHSFARLGNFATPPIVVALIAVSSWRVAFLVLSTVGLFWIIAWQLFFNDPPLPPLGVEGVKKSTEAIFARPVARKARRMGGPARESAQTESPRPSFATWLAVAKKTAPATAVNFCYGWTLWLFLTWIPSFFVQSYHASLTGSAFYSAGVFFGGFAGDALGGIATDAVLRATGNLVLARRSVIVAGFAGSCVCLFGVMLVSDIRLAALLLSLAFFFAELIVAPIWAVTMDIVPRHAGLASGIMNFGSAFAGIVSPLFYGIVVDLTGSWTIPFSVSVGLLVLGAVLTFALNGGEQAGAVLFQEMEATSFGTGGGAA